MFNLKNEVEGVIYFKKCWCILKFNDKKVRGVFDFFWCYVYFFSGYFSLIIGIWGFFNYDFNYWIVYYNEVSIFFYNDFGDKFFVLSGVF